MSDTEAEAEVKDRFPRAMVADARSFGDRFRRVYSSPLQSALILGDGDTDEAAWEAARTWLRDHHAATGGRPGRPSDDLT